MVRHSLAETTGANYLHKNVLKLMIILSSITLLFTSNKRIPGSKFYSDLVDTCVDLPRLFVG